MELEKRLDDIRVEVYDVKQLIERLVPRCPRCGKPVVTRLVVPSLREGYTPAGASRVYVLVLECSSCHLRLASNTAFVEVG
jgi:predicted RNA-binding Zn-ribbon protein involved in translation (DUF1610 family)